MLLTQDPHEMRLETFRPGDATITVTRGDTVRVLIVEVRHARLLRSHLSRYPPPRAPRASNSRSSPPAIIAASVTTNALLTEVAAFRRST